MKANIHPQYFEDTVVICACGKSFITGSTKQRISVEVCSQCHPFYTGEQRLIDTKGKAEEFNRRMEQAKTYKQTRAAKKNREEKGEREAKTLKELRSEA